MIYTIVLRDKNGSLTELISFDSITDFSQSLSASVTKNVVENGFPVTDHMSLENVKFDLSAIVTGYSLFDDDLELTWNGQSFTNNSNSTTDNKLFKIKKSIESLISNRRLFSLLCSEHNEHNSDMSIKHHRLTLSSVVEHTNCVCTNIQFSQSSGKGDVIQVKIGIEQIQIATTETREMSPQEAKPTLVGIKATTKPLNSASSTTAAQGKVEEGNTNKTVEQLAKTNGQKTYTESELRSSDYQAKIELSKDELDKILQERNQVRLQQDNVSRQLK